MCLDHFVTQRQLNPLFVSSEELVLQSQHGDRAEVIYGFESDHSSAFQLLLILARLTDENTLLQGPTDDDERHECDDNESQFPAVNEGDDQGGNEERRSLQKRGNPHASGLHKYRGVTPSE